MIKYMVEIECQNPNKEGVMETLEALARLGFAILLLCLVFIPLGIWKLVDIIIWLCH